MTAGPVQRNLTVLTTKYQSLNTGRFYAVQMSFPFRKQAPWRQMLLLLLTWWRFAPQTSSTEALQPHNELFDPFSKSPRIQNNAHSQTMVVASITSEGTSWILRELADKNHAIFVADDPMARLHPVANKGHEAMVYLTYIVDHYHNLSDTTIFTHSHQDAWHNNDLFDFDLSRMVRAVSNERVHRVGFFNLRCHHESGCPDHIQPFARGDRDNIEEGVFAEVCPISTALTIQSPPVWPQPAARNSPCRESASERSHLPDGSNTASSYLTPHSPIKSPAASGSSPDTTSSPGRQSCARVSTTATATATVFVSRAKAN